MDGSEQRTDETSLSVKSYNITLTLGILISTPKCPI